MLAFARAELRRFRTVARRCTAGGRRRGPSPPVRIAAAGDAITLTAHLGEVVVAGTAPACERSEGEVKIPLAALDDWCGPGTGRVSLEPVGTRTIVAHWNDGGVARSAEIEWIEDELTWPDAPAATVVMPATFRIALHETGRTASTDPTRYALHRLQVRGQAGQVIGTDGKQALVQGGFTFPFQEDLLVQPVPVFGSKELTGALTIGLAPEGDWLCVAIGSWRVWLHVDREGRFPDVLGAVPRACGIGIVFDNRDADKLVRALPELPGADDDPKPVTLDLGTHVQVHARDPATKKLVTVPLLSSRVTGPPTRIAVNRQHLGRALALGFREFRVRAADRPMFARHGDHTFLFAALAPDAVVGPSDSSAKSDASTNVARPRPTPAPVADAAADSPVPVRRYAMPARDTPPAERNGHADAPGEPTDPLADAEALRNALAEATSMATRLVTALRYFKRERKVVVSALSSLKQLNLGTRGDRP